MTTAIVRTTRVLPEQNDLPTGTVVIIKGELVQVNRWRHMSTTVCSEVLQRPQDSSQERHTGFGLIEDGLIGTGDGAQHVEAAMPT